MFQTISQNQEAFVRMINEEEEGGGGGAPAGTGGGGGGPSDPSSGASQLMEPGVIAVTPQDKDAIERVSLSSISLVLFEVIVEER